MQLPIKDKAEQKKRGKGRQIRSEEYINQYQDDSNQNQDPIYGHNMFLRNLLFHSDLIAD